MNTIQTLFLNNETLEAEIEAFCASDPEFVNRQQQFDATAHKIAELVGFEQYNAFEKSLWAYLYRTADLYYLFGLGLRQEVLRSLGAG